ncbi:MAG TPA: ComF family protein [Candidatus Paceibacterota bacterium]
MRYFKKFKNIVLEILFPPTCISCKKLIHANENKALCAPCLEAIDINKVPIYIKPWLTISAVGSYDNPVLKELIHSFKYQGLMGSGNSLIDISSIYIEKALLGSNLNIKNYIIIPIPLYNRKLKKRGFNQAEIIAKGISDKFNIEIWPNAIIKTKDTRSQTELKNNKERLKNIKNSFRLNPIFTERLKNHKTKNLILVDDVYTSGATMNEAAKALKRLGAKNIIGFVIAKT